MKSGLHDKYKESLISYYQYLLEYILNNRSIQVISLIDNLYNCGQSFSRWSTLLDSEILVQEVEKAEAENIFKQYRRFYGE